MVCGNFILPEACKPCLFLSYFQFAQLKLSVEERKARNHRLCKRGGFMESLVPETLRLQAKHSLGGVLIFGQED